MSAIILHDKEVIHRRLMQHVYLQVYAIGDLDDFFWPYTVWFGHHTAGELDAIALLYIGQSLPTLLAFADPVERMDELLRSIQNVLPRKFYAHLSPGLETVFSETFDVTSYGEHYKMALHDSEAVTQYDCARVSALTVSDLDEINRFYAQSYPANWFDPRMLDTAQYFGIRDGDSLISVAGVHVYSPHYRVAALGNIATHPQRRAEGLGRRVTAKLCQSLLNSVDYIGLNVKADNQAAISCYRRLGFEVVASYGEFLFSMQ